MTRSRFGWLIVLFLVGLALASPVPAEEPETGDDTAVLEGVVVDEAGRPVPDVCVEAWCGATMRWFVVPVSSRAPFDDLFEDPLPCTEDSPVRRVGRTDAKGRFRLAGLRAVEGFRIRARPESPGRRGRAEILHDVPRPGHFLRLVVASARTVKGRLVDEDGQGLRGWITAQAHPGRDLWFGRSWYSDFHVEDDIATDDDGRFTFAAPRGARIRIDAFFPGERCVSVLAFLGPEEDVVTLVVPTSGGASVVGRVRDLEGRPIAGARVMVHVQTADGAGYRPSHTGLARTDAQGAFSVDHLPATTLSQISVEAPGFSIWNRAPYLTPLLEGDPLELDVTLVRTARLLVRVVGEAGEGLPGARIRLVGQMQPTVGRSWDRTVTTDAEGVARLDDVPLGKGSLQVWAPGHYLPVAPVLHPLENPLGRSLPALEPGSESELTVVMKKGPTLHGTVVDAQGRGVPRARLTFHMNRSDAPRGNGFVLRHERTDAKGRFELGGLPPLALLTIRVDHEDHPHATTEIDPAGLTGEAPLRIVLPEPARVAGHVLDAEGRPVADVLVQCAGARASVVTDAEGRFAFARVAPGRRALHLGNVASPATVLYLDLSAGQAVTDVTLRHPGGGRGVLEGVLLAADGAPTFGLAIEVRSLAQPGASGRAYTDAEGRFRLERLPPGRYTLSAGGVTSTVTIGEQGTTSTTLALLAPPPSFVIDGVVVDAQGRPVDSARVRIAYPGDGDHATRGQTAVIGGRFRARIRGEPHEMALRVENARDATGRSLNAAPARVVVAGPAQEPVLVTLAPALRLRGRVVEEDGQPIAHLPITLTRQAREPRARRTYVQPLQARTDEDGRFEVPGLDDHPYFVGLPSAPHWIPPGPIVARPGKDEIEIRLLRWRSLVTIVTAPDGSPVKGCRVEAYVLGSGRNRGSFTALTNEEGRAEHPRLKPHDELTLRILPPHPGTGDVADLCPAIEEGVSPGGEPIEVQLSVGSRLGGRVLDTEGLPIPHATVALVIPKPAPDQRPIQVQGIPSLLSLRQQTRTDAQGAFLFRRLPPDQVVSVFVTGPQDADSPYFRETVKDLVTGNENVEVVLLRGVSIEGRVPDVDPGALAGLVIRAQPLLKGYPKATFRFDGTTTTFKLGKLRPGPYEFHVHGGKNLIYERVQAVEAPATEVVLRVRCVHDLAGAVLGTQGKAFRVEFHVPGHEAFKGNVEAGGLFRLHRLPDAKGTLLIHQKGDARVALVEDVYTGRGDPLIVELIEGRPITGTIVGQTRPLAGGRVIATRGSIRFEGVVTEGGAFHTPALPPGAYELAFDFRYPKDGRVPAPSPVEAGTTDLVLEWASKP